MIKIRTRPGLQYDDEDDDLPSVVCLALNLHAHSMHVEQESDERVLEHTQNKQACGKMSTGVCKLEHSLHAQWLCSESIL